MIAGDSRLTSLPSGPLQIRIALAHVDRGLERVRKVIASRDPRVGSEPLILRVLALCLFYEDGLHLVDRPPRREVPDLELVDPEGKVAIWIACGVADAEEIRRVITHNRGVAVHALFDHPAAAAALLRQLGAIKKRPPGFEDISVWTIDQAAVVALASRDELRQRWAVTVVADHLYVDSDGLKTDSAVTRHPLPPAGP